MEGHSDVFLVYAFGSLLALDPWHMFTSFIPYMFLSPMYINVLNMCVPSAFFFKPMLTLLLSYAFSNLDDVRFLPIFSLNRLKDYFLQISWGTKQDSTPETDLGAVIQDSHSQVDVEMLTEPADINSIYEESLANLRDRRPVDDGKSKAPPSIAEKEQAAKEYYASVRTNVLLAWVLSNVSIWHTWQDGAELTSFY